MSGFGSFTGRGPGRGGSHDRGRGSDRGGHGSSVGGSSRGGSSRGGSSDRGGRGGRRGNRGQGSGPPRCEKCGDVGHFKRNCDWTPPTQQNTYVFQTEDIDNNSRDALNAVPEYVQDIIHKTTPDAPLDSADLEKEKHLRGLRTDFGQYADNGTIVTNYLRISTSIQKIYVYDIKMVQEYVSRADGNPPDEKLLRDKLCKERIFAQILNDPQCQSLHVKSGSWVTDYSNIWSVVELFPQQGAGSVGVPSFPNLTCNNLSHATIDVELVTITPRFDIDFSQTVAKLFRRQTGTASKDDDPAILARGLNAFVTEPMRRLAN